MLTQNHGEKSMKVLFAIYADKEPLLEKVDSDYNSPEKRSLLSRIRTES